MDTEPPESKPPVNVLFRYLRCIYVGRGQWAKWVKGASCMVMAGSWNCVRDLSSAHRCWTVTLHTRLKKKPPVKEPFLLLWNICCFICHCSFRISSCPVWSLPVTPSLFPQDYHRPSVEEILENPLIADLVAEEQRRNPERRGRRLGEAERLQDSSPVLSELRLKEIQLQEREAALKAREESLERKSGGTRPSAPRLVLVCERLCEHRVSCLCLVGHFYKHLHSRDPYIRLAAPPCWASFSEISRCRHAVRP